MQTIEELIALTNDYREQLNAITSFDDRIAQLTAQKGHLVQQSTGTSQSPDRTACTGRQRH